MKSSLIKLALTGALTLAAFAVQAGVPTPEPAIGIGGGISAEAWIPIGGGRPGAPNPFPEKDPVNPFGDWLNEPLPGFPFPGPDPDPVLPIIKPGKP